MACVNIERRFVSVQHFTRGNVRHFLLSMRESLGPLTFLRIWHDNSGEGVHGGWFLDKVIIEDLQTNMRYLFSEMHNYFAAASCFQIAMPFQYQLVRD